jgi:hypothetical protein
MKSFKVFIHLREEMGVASVPVNNIAHTGKTQIARYDPLLKIKLIRRKLKKEMKS